MTYKGVDIPATAKAWQLYTAKKGAGKAARKLADAMKKTFDKFDELRQKTFILDARNRAYEQDMEPAMGDLSDFGAEDTEPSCVVGNVFGMYINLVVYGDTNGGADDYRRRIW